MVFALCVLGCSTTKKPPDADRSAVQAPYDPAFFCDWEFELDLFATAAADYAAARRRVVNAWGAINNRTPPGDHFLKRGKCWHGAILYLGVFGARSELPGLMQLATHDAILAHETADPTRQSGVTNLGEARSLALRMVYQAIGAQIGRQRIFDSRLDAHAQAAEAMLRRCALDVATCMPNAEMHIYRRQRLQRNAVRGLGMAGTPAALRTLKQVDATSRDGLMPYAVESAWLYERQIRANLGEIRARVPRP